MIDSMRTKRKGLFGWGFSRNQFRWRYVFEGNRTTKPTSKAFRVRGANRIVLGADPSDFLVELR